MIKMNNNFISKEKIIEYLKLQFEDFTYINIQDLIKDIEDGDFNNE